MKRALAVFALLACSLPALAANNRGPKGTATTSFPDRGLMDVLYARQDGVQSSDTHLFGDPNAPAANRGWRIHRSKTIYLDVQVDGSLGAVVYNTVGLTFGYLFKLDGTTILAFLPRTVDGSSLKVGEFATGVGSSRFLALQSGSANNTVTFSPIDQNRCGGAGVPCELHWVFRASTAFGSNIGQAEMVNFWNGVGAGDLRGNMNVLTAQTDSNSVNVRLKTRAEVGTGGGSPRLFTNVNRPLEINQTKAGRDVLKVLLQNVLQWTLGDSSGDLVDNAGGNLVDTVDVGSHTHVGGGANGAALGTDSVGATQISSGAVGTSEIDSTVCTSVLTSLTDGLGTSTTYYFMVGILTSFPSPTESDADFHRPTSGAVVYHSMVAYVSTAPDNGAGTQSWTFTLRDDAADTALSCTISEAATSCSDSDSVTPAINSKMAWKSVPSGTPAAAGITTIMLCTGA